jgi:tetratricopeptide (TPR) repeat protein
MSAPPPADDFPIDGLQFPSLRHFIDANGGEAAFEGLTTDDVKERFIVPQTHASKLSLCAQMKRAGDARVQPATWFVSHAWRYKFLDLVKALEAFFADKGGVVVIWLDLFSTSQHSTFSKPPEWWQQTFISAIGRMGQMVMVMTPWDSPVCLTRAWCLIELYACRSSGSSFGVAFPPAERARFLQQITYRSGAFYDMLGKVSTEKSECSREEDRQRIFAAVRGLDGGFSGLDRSVLSTMTEWLQRQLQEEAAGALAAGHTHVECRMMNALAELFRNKGEYDRALPLHEECLAKRKRVLGDEHPDTLQSLNNLALLFKRKGEYDRALPLFEECLAKRKRALGDEHPDTLTSLNNLAALFDSKGEYDRALPLYEECLAKRKRVLGDEHPDTLTSLNNLAGLFDIKGEYDRALPLYEECLAKRKRVLGDEHPDTLTSLNNLAGLFNNKGEYDRALPLYEECLAKQKRVLGDEHPDTLQSLNNLALLFKRKGEYDRALPLYEECLAKKKRVLGDEHPDTILSLNNLANLFYSKGEYDRALPLYEECLAKRKRVLGDEHPDTLQSLNNLALLFYSKGEYDRALPLYEECLAKKKRVLGDEHPHTKTFHRNRDACAWHLGR